MKIHTLKRAVLTTLLVAFFYNGTASAESAFAKENFSGTLTFTTDYIYRGLSFTSEDPAIQGSFDWSYNNLYAGIWGSNIELANSSIELDYYAGYASSAGGLDYDVMFLYYNFPSAEDSGSGNLETDYWELWLTLGHGFDTALSPYVSILGTYSPDWTLEDGDGFYIKGMLALSLANDWGLDFGIGYQDVEGDDATGSSGAFCIPATDTLCDGFSYTHWEAGLTKAYHGFDFDLRYHSTDEDDDLEDYFGGDENIDDRIVFSISRSF